MSEATAGLRGFLLAGIIVVSLDGDVLTGEVAGFRISVMGCPSVEVDRPEGGWAGRLIAAPAATTTDNVAAQLEDLLRELSRHVLPSDGTLVAFWPALPGDRYVVTVETRTSDGVTGDPATITITPLDHLVGVPVGIDVATLSAARDDDSIALRAAAELLPMTGQRDLLSGHGVPIRLRTHALPARLFDGRKHTIEAVTREAAARIGNRVQIWSCEPRHATKSHRGRATVQRPLSSSFPVSEAEWVGDLILGGAAVPDIGLTSGSLLFQPYDGRADKSVEVFVFGHDFASLARTPAVSQLLETFGNAASVHFVLPTAEARSFQNEVHRGMRLDQVLPVLSLDEFTRKVGRLDPDAVIVLLPGGSQLEPAAMTMIREAMRDPTFSVVGPIRKVLEFAGHRVVVDNAPDAVTASPYALAAIYAGQAARRDIRHVVQTHEGVSTPVVRLHGRCLPALASEATLIGAPVGDGLALDVVVDGTTEDADGLEDVITVVQTLRGAGCVPTVACTRGLAKALDAHPGIEGMQILISPRPIAPTRETLAIILKGARPSALLDLATAKHLVRSVPAASLRAILHAVPAASAGTSRVTLGHHGQHGTEQGPSSEAGTTGPERAVGPGSEMSFFFAGQA